MKEELQLALDFLKEKPDSAIRILEQHEAGQVADFLRSIPDYYALLVFARALPGFTGNLCKLLGVETATRLLLAQDTSRMVTVLRHLDHPTAEAILQESPQVRRHACQLLMHFPLYQVGAWIVPNTAAVASEFSVAETLNFLKASTEETFSKYVFVVDREGIPQGRISCLTLLKATGVEKIGALMETDLDVISANMLTNQAAKLACWESGDVMPVVGLQQQMIGILRHADLRRALQQQHRPMQPAAADSDPLSGIFQVYGQSLLAVFDSASNVVENDLKS